MASGQPPRAHRARSVAGLVGAAVVLQLVLALFYWMPAPSAAALAAPTWELVGLVAILFAVGRLEPRGALARGVRALLTALALLLGVLGLAEGVARREFGYGAELAINVKYVGSLLHTMYRSESLPWFVLELAVAALVVVLVVAALHLSIGRLARAAREPGSRRGLAIGGAAYVAVAALTVGVAGPLTPRVVDELDLAVHHDQRLAELGDVLEREAGEAARVPMAIGEFRPSILVFVVETYGSALFLQPGFYGYRSYLDEEARALAAAGYASRSRYFRSPVFGGSSWMANGSILCGVRIPDPRRYASLYHSDLRCLPRVLGEAGYHTVLAAPNTVGTDPPFLQRFPFDEYYLSDSYGYRGPMFSWSNMPDQFAIDLIDRRVVAAPRAEPLFVYYMLTSSHFPWRLIPPYLEDWSRVGDGAIFNEVEPLLFRGNSVHSGKRFHKAYDLSVRYTMHAIADYLIALPPDRAPLVLIIGDHQPRKPLADPAVDPWWVPLHVLSRDPSLVERFADLGYVPGMVPSADGTVVGLERFVDDLTRALRDP
jgi:hypothetical protein